MMAICLSSLMAFMAFTQNAFGRGKDFASVLKADVVKLQKASDKDPETFKDGVATLEAKYASVKNPVERSVAHAMLASCYAEMGTSGLADFDREVTALFQKKKAEHLSHVLDAPEALAEARVKDYAALFLSGDDDGMYGNDMLAVLTRYVCDAAEWGADGKKMRIDACEKAFSLYRRRGNMDGYGLMKMRWIESVSGAPKSLGGISASAAADSLHALLMEVKDAEVGADVAMEYCDALGNRMAGSDDGQCRDSKILFLKWALAHVAKSKSTPALQQELNVLLRPRVEVGTLRVGAAGCPAEVTVDMWHCDNVRLTVRRYAGEKQLKDGSSQLLLSGEVVESRFVSLAIDSANAARQKQGLPLCGKATAEFALPAGRFVMVAEACGERDVQRFHVSSMCVMAAPLNDSVARYVVADIVTGRPLKGVRVLCGDGLADDDIWTGKAYGKKGVKTLVTDDEGAVCAGSWVCAVKDDDDFTNVLSPYYKMYRPWTHEGLKASVMTDRSIYRPGQTVKAALIAYVQHGDVLHVADDASLSVAVSMGDKRDTLRVVTNAMGSASFDYVLPDDGHVGTVSFAVLDGKSRLGSSYVRVEEYKRPTFDVKMEGDTRGAFGQAVRVTGVAEMFAGAPVQGAKVSYQVSCRPASRWFGGWDYIDDARGSTQTGDDGRFSVPVVLTDEYVSDDARAMAFRVNVVVTDVAGETHEAEWRVYVGEPFGHYDVRDAGRMLNLAGKDSLVVDACDVNGKRVALKSRYRLMHGDKLCAEGSFVSGDPLYMPQGLRPGVQYRLCVESADTAVRMSAMEYELVTYSTAVPELRCGSAVSGVAVRKYDDVRESDVLYAEKSTFEAGKGIDLYMSTRETDACVYINVVGEHGLVNHYAVVTDGSMKRLSLPYSPEWGECMAVSMMYVRGGKHCFKSLTFTLAEPDNKLSLEWKTFRNRLEPGQKETWTLTVRDKDGHGVSGAELMAVLYDASLDRISGHSWSFSTSFGRSGLRWHFDDMVSVPDEASLSISGRLGSVDVRQRRFASFVPFEHDRFARIGNFTAASPRFKGRGMVLAEAAYGSQRVASSGMVMSDSMAGDEEADAGEGADVASLSDAPMRTNFAETAFFLPHLMSDAKGDVRIAFTLPESLTEWQFLGLAHTADVRHGSIAAQAKAQRALMLRPSMPRFVRRGDRVVIAASVVNMDDAALDGSVRMRLIDAATGQTLHEESRRVSMPAGKTVAVDFAFDVDRAWNDIDCEMTVASGDKGDGERNPLPVLPAERMVTETVPFFIKGDADGGKVTKDIDLSALFNGNSPSADSRSMKVEYMDGPAWMCIEALRSVKNPETDDAVSWSAALAANASLAELLRAFPVMERYESADSLRRSVAKAEDKLAGLQKADGGWAWFNGMESNRYVTLAVCESMVETPSLSPRMSSMLRRGVAYLDSVMLTAYKQRRADDLAVMGNDMLRYLSVAARTGLDGVSREVSKMRSAYAKMAEKDVGNLTIYGVARTSLMLRDCGRVKAADRLVGILKDYTVEKPGLGRFYATDAAYYSWMDYRIPTQLAAMRAIMRKDSADAFLPDMLLWLVAQKQVQRWDNPMTAIEVARLLQAIEPLDNLREVSLPVISVDGAAPLSMERGVADGGRERLEEREPALALEGCVVAEVPEEALAGGVSSMKVEKGGRGVSWGAVHASFSENADSLKAYAAGELAVGRKCYVQRGGVGEWMPCGEDIALRVGDRVRVRHVVTADRDMDFVKVSSQYPACFEPVSQLSGYRWMGGRGGFVSVHDSCVDMFFDWFTRGTATLDVEYYVARVGEYGMGFATVECEYAKQYGGHTAGQRVAASK